LIFAVGSSAKGLAQLLGVSIVPSGIERALIANQLINAHPSGKVVFLGEIPDARQHGDRLGNRIEAEDAHRAALRAQQPEKMFDERRLARPVGTDQAVNTSSWKGQAHRGQGGHDTEAARQLRYGDHCFTDMTIDRRTEAAHRRETSNLYMKKPMPKVTFCPKRRLSSARTGGS
jgi:hypothetical protein